KLLPFIYFAQLISSYTIVPARYSSRGFPEGFALQPTDWALTDRVVKRPSIEAIIDGEIVSIRPLSTLDLEFLSNNTVRLARE
ncbi:MAG: hypothetical protein AABX07_02685, partial [Nanoarchaeota archaeon]